ncbi:MAG: hypothetical protein P4L50_19175 [Anaerolineaceae bacterium]|nr:hypothetical protein [Anaerolineaceae bacterium]
MSLLQVFISPEEAKIIAGIKIDFGYIKRQVAATFGIPKEKMIDRNS